MKGLHWPLFFDWNYDEKVNKILLVLRHAQNQKSKLFNALLTRFWLTTSADVIYTVHYSKT